MAYEPSEMRPAGAPDSSYDPPPPGYPEDRSSDEIERDIRRTRADMDETVDALEERLRPRHLIDDLVQWFRSGGTSKASSAASSAASGAKDSVQEYGSAIIEKLKAHPMPAALIGAGLVWMIFEGDERASRRSYEPRKWDVPPYSGSYVDARTGQPYDASYGAGAGTQSAGQEQQPSMAQQAKDKLAGATESVKDTARSAAEGMRHARERMGERVGEWSGSARDYASYASERASRGYETGKHYVERGMDDYPLAMGAAAMALGVLTGLVMPRTRTEDKWMGEQSDELKDRAKEMGREAVERGKDVAAATTDAVSEEAERQGLTPGELAEKAKHVAQDAARAAGESARREGIDPDSLAHKGKEIADRTKETAKEETRRQKDQFHA